MKTCPYAFRERNQVSLRCLLICDKKNNYCGNQYFCNNTKQWENTEQAKNCPVPEKYKR